MSPAHAASPTGRAPGPARVVFVDNFFCERVGELWRTWLSPHLGLMTLGALLEEAGHPVEIFDPKQLFAEGRYGAPDASFFEHSAEHLLAREADILGFTAYGVSFPYVLEVARRIKARRPGQCIMLGGPHATILGPAILEACPELDVLVRYEAEPIILELVRTLARGEVPEALPDVVFRQGGQLVSTPRKSTLPEMDALPRPALHLYPLSRQGPSELSIEAGRGCPFRCTFCSTSNFFQRRYRLKSSSRMIEEMEWARATYGVSTFNLEHDLFGLRRPSLLEFCREVKGRGLEWKCSMRPDTLDGEMLEALVEAGCRHIYFGVETGSQRMQRLVEKRLDLEATRARLRQVVEAGVACTASFITGFPEETEDDQDATLDMIGELLCLSPARLKVQLHVLSPEPGTALARKHEGDIAFDGLGPEGEVLFEHERVRDAPELFSVFYHFRSHTPRWRILLASIFVSRLLAELGSVLTAHLTTRLFGGSLAAMFRAATAGAPASVEGFAQGLELLRTGLDMALERLPSESAYARELVRFSRWNQPGVAPERVGAMAVESATLHAEAGLADVTEASQACFTHDVLALARHLLERPGAPVPEPLTRSRTTWCLRYRDAEERAFVVELEHPMSNDPCRTRRNPWAEPLCSAP